MGVVFIGVHLDGRIVQVDLPYTDEELEALGGLEGLEALGIPEDPWAEGTGTIIGQFPIPKRPD